MSKVLFKEDDHHPSFKIIHTYLTDNLYRTASLNCAFPFNVHSYNYGLTRDIMFYMMTDSPDQFLLVSYSVQPISPNRDRVFHLSVELKDFNTRLSTQYHIYDCIVDVELELF